MDDSRAGGALPPDHPLYAPGIKWRRRANGSEAAYWLAPPNTAKTGWAIKCVRLSGTEEEMAARCREIWAELTAFRSGQPAQSTHSINWLIWRYQTDGFSPYRTVREKTRNGYDQSLRIIGNDVGTFLIASYLEGGIMRPRLLGSHIREWHRRWALPNEDDKEKKPRPVRAWHAITMLRILFSYAVELGVPGSEYLRELIGVIRVPMAEARVAAPERDMVLAHVAKSAERGLLSVAITTLAQFEFTERRTHIIGTWEGKQWRPGWLWTGITPDSHINYHQTKVGKVERSFDLKMTPALLDLIKRIPEEQRVGPVIVCERTGKPWKERHYIRVFREIAREVGMPDDVWSMDMRAGGATEAGNIQGITQTDLQAAGGWKDPAMASRYTRDTNRRAARVINLRQAAAALLDAQGDGKGGVYFLQCQGGDYHVKIGYTANISERMHGLSTGCPYPVTLIGSHPCHPKVEKILHQMFYAHRANGEWFNPVSEILAAAKRLPFQLCESGKHQGLPQSLLIPTGAKHEIPWEQGRRNAGNTID